MTLNIVTIDDLNAAVAILNSRITLMAEATQQDIDALTTAVQQTNATVDQVKTDLAASQTKLQAEIDALAGQGVDVAALQAAVDEQAQAVAPLDQTVIDLGNLQPTPPPPGP